MKHSEYPLLTLCNGRAQLPSPLPTPVSKFPAIKLNSQAGAELKEFLHDPLA